MDGSTMNGADSVGPGSIPDGATPGQAALLLVESLMHCLVAKSVLSREEFIEIVDGAAEVQQELLISNASFPSDRSGSLLYPLAAAFKKELGR